MLHTSKGWIGIQVKSHSCHTKHPAVGSRSYVAHALRLDRGRGRSGLVNKLYYESRGVGVFALSFNGGFYLVPIAVIEGGEVALSKISHFWEAWQEVLGLPTELSGHQAEAELHQIEMMWEQSP